MIILWKKKWAIPENLCDEVAASTLIVDEVEKVNMQKDCFFLQVVFYLLWF